MDDCERCGDKYYSLLHTMEVCKSWFEKWSPTAPCIDGTDRIHPMLEQINKTLEKQEA